MLPGPAKERSLPPHLPRATSPVSEFPGTSTCLHTPRKVENRVHPARVALVQAGAPWAAIVSPSCPDAGDRERADPVVKDERARAWMEHDTHREPLRKGVSQPAEVTRNREVARHEPSSQSPRAVLRVLRARDRSHDGHRSGGGDIPRLRIPRRSTRSQLPGDERVDPNHVHANSSRSSRAGRTTS